MAARSTSRPTSRTPTSPKVQDLGDQVSADPGAPVRVPPPELVGRPDRCDNEHRWLLAQPGGRRTRGEGCPMADPAMREAFAFAIDKNEINTRLLGGTVQVANTNISPGRLVLRGPAPGDVRSGQGHRDPRGRPAGPTPTATASARRTASRPRSSCARPPARSASTPSPSSPIG